MIGQQRESVNTFIPSILYAEALMLFREALQFQKQYENEMTCEVDS